MPKSERWPLSDVVPDAPLVPDAHAVTRKPDGYAVTNHVLRVERRGARA